MTTRWRVLLGREPVWFINDEPLTFATFEEAQKAFEEFCRDEEEAVREGFLEDASSLYDDYRIEEVQQ